MPPVLSKLEAPPAGAADAKHQDWTRACSEVLETDMDEGILTPEERAMYDKLRESASTDAGIEQLTEQFEKTISEIESESERCWIGSKKRWATAQQHVRMTSSHLNIEMWKWAHQQGWPDEFIHEHIFEGFDLE